MDRIADACPTGALCPLTDLVSLLAAMFVRSRFTLGKSMVVIGSMLCQLDSLGQTRQLPAASSDNLLETTALAALSNKPSWLVSTYALHSLILRTTQLAPTHYSV